MVKNQELSTQIVDTIRKNRKNIKDSTLKTYKSILINLFHNAGGTGTDIVSFFNNNVKSVLKYLEQYTFNARKTKLASIVSLLNSGKSADIYRDVMNKDIKTYDDHIRDGKMSDNEKSNWITQDELKTIYDQKLNESKHLFSKKVLNKNNLQDLQDFIILSLYTMIEPRRIMDYTEFKVRNINPETDNYMKGNTFVFNKYKTSTSYGKQVIKIPPMLNSIIRRYSQLHDNEYLLFSPSTNKKLQQSQLTQRLNHILGRRASVNILRHSFLTEKYKNMPMLKEMEETAKNMGHSVLQDLEYRKQT